MLLEALRWLAPPVAAAAVAALFDRRLGRAAGGAATPPPGLSRPWRRLAAGALLAGLFYLTLFAPLSLSAEAAVPFDLSAVPPWQLFLMHAVLVAGLGAWLALAYGGSRPPMAVGPAPPGEVAAPVGPPVDGYGPPAPSGPPPVFPEPAAAAPAPAPGPLAFLRLRARAPGVEIGVGLLVGLAIWALALTFATLLVSLVSAAGGGDLLPTRPPPLILLVAGQPVWLRLAISVSAGLVEEVFFRGFLQPRLGIWLTTGLFVLAHAAYGAPAMFVTVAFLSLAYGWLARRRGSVWAAAAAHAVFDAVQLLAVLPAALRAIEDQPLGPPLP